MRNTKDDILREMKDLVNNITARINRSLLYGAKKKIPLLPQPKTLVGGTLKPYQLESLAWMAELEEHRLNGILADDMGLGKTIQAIAFLCYLNEKTGAKGKHLLVVPKNVLRNWDREISKWATNFKAVILPGTQLEREACLTDYVRPKKFDILIATFQAVQYSELTLRKIQWNTLILDEAHSIKNDETKLAQCLRRFSANFKLLMTGTPLSNQLKELWCLLNFILPDIFTDDTLFMRIEQVSNTNFDDEEEKIKFQAEVAKLFKLMINPFMMRRCKNQLELGLKDKKEITLFTNLSKLQLTLYRNYLKTKSVYGDQTRTQAISHIQLSKISLHPYMFPNIEDPSLPPQGEHLIENSGKLKLLDKLLKKLLKEKHKVLIFSQFVSMLKILEDYCDYRQYQYCMIDGTTSLDDRDEAVNRFFNDERCNIFLISTRAGGIGLNLVAADIVILYDLDWNPQMDKQAMDRAYRLGQKNNVLVFRLINNNTIEERKLEVQKYKLIWDQLVIQKGGLARIKTSEEKLEKLNLDKIAFSGAEEIFKVQENLDDQAIQDIIRMGEEKDRQKTKQIREKLEKEFEKYGDNTDPYEGFVNGGSDSLKCITSYEEKPIGFVPSKKLERPNPLHKNEYLKSEIFKRVQKPKPLRKLLPYKLYSGKDEARRLLDLIEESNEEEAQHYKNKLKEISFDNWMKDDYDLFVEACKQYGSQNYLKIAEKVGKSPKQVQEYREAFFARAHEEPSTNMQLRRIQKADQKFELDAQIAELEEKVRSYPDEAFGLNSKPLKLQIAHSSNSQRLLLNDIRGTGVGFEEHSDILEMLVPEIFRRCERVANSTILHKKFLQQKVKDAENSKSKQSLEAEFNKRYNAMEKKLAELKIQQLDKEEEKSNNSAATEVKN